MDQTLLIAIGGGILAFTLLCIIAVLTTGIKPNRSRSIRSYGQNKPCSNGKPQVYEDHGCSKSKPIRCQSGGGNGKVILFFAPWCGHCKTIKPIWEKLEQVFPDRISSINADKYKEIAKKFGIDSYPTIYYCPNGLDSAKDIVPYEGERTFQELSQFIKEYTN